MQRRATYGAQLDLSLSTWVKLARAYALFWKRTGDHVRSVHLTVGQFSAMEAIYHKGPLTPGELCAKQLVSPGNMTVVLDNLEREGMITRIASQTDGRSVTIHLTPHGESLMGRVFPEHARLVGELLAVLSQQEQLALGDLLRKLGKSLQSERGVQSERRTGDETVPDKTFYTKEMGVDNS